MNNRISNKDKKVWNNFINSKEKLPNKDLKNNQKKIINTKSLDLHGYTLEDANKKIENFILENYQNGITKLLVVTGKGLHSDVEKNPYVSKNLSILKYSIPEFIRNNSEINKYINSFAEASIEDGGSGAFYIYLKKKNK